MSTLLHVGDQVWLYTYVPAVKTGRTKKLASLWCGPNTVIDRVSPVNYKIQLLGVPSKTSVVHHNRLKHCFGTPKSPPVNTLQSDPTAHNSLSLYSEVITGQSPTPVGGYTSSSNPPTVPAAPLTVSTAPPTVPTAPPPVPASTPTVTVVDLNALEEPLHATYIDFVTY